MGASKEYRRVSREQQPMGTVVRVGGVEIGGSGLAMMVGPCAVESREQLWDTALAVKRAGFPILRAGAFKPRTSPYAFRGMLLDGLRMLDEVRQELGLLVVTEVMSEADVELVAAHADVLQIGSRTMHAFRLLEAVAAMGKPVLLKRGFHATVREWLLAAEYLLNCGNPDVILCERGIRSFDDEFTRNVFDLSAVAVAKRETHLPVIADPSHGTGRADLVITMARAAIAAGADGLIVETHPSPATALCDGDQSIPTAALPELAEAVERIGIAVGRTLAGAREPLLV